MAADIEVELFKYEKMAIARIKGHIDSTTTVQLEKHLKEEADSSNTLILNFSEVGYCSSAGLRLVLALAKKKKAAGSHLLCAAMQPDVEHVFKVAGFSNHFPNHLSEDHAVEAALKLDIEKK